MMLKRFGMFALLAVCLFAIVIVMGGCGGDDDNCNGGCIDGAAVDSSDFVDLAGVYTYDGPGLELSGVLSLYPSESDFEANLWFITDEIETSDESGTWTADSCNIRLLGRSYGYTRSGTSLTIRNLPTLDGRKDIKWVLSADL